MTSSQRYAVVLSAVLFAVAAAGAQDLHALRARAAGEGWTFEIAPNPAAARPPEALHSLVPPKDWRTDAPFRTFDSKAELPAAFDWRPWLPPVRDQRGCGSCWAFSTVGALECAIGVKDGVMADLSEQWLVSCNSESEPPVILGKGEWGCNGGWFAHDYHQWKTDPCGGYGAVPEAAFPYRAADVPCQCPYPHTYFIDNWAYIGGEETIPGTSAIKQAIAAYGPVSAAVFVDEPFYLYYNGVYNHDPEDLPNHGIVLVGWDDTLGEHGAWILRNSWGADWGQGGYMYIAYGCASVGFGACYVDYAGTGQAEGPTVTAQPRGGFVETGAPFVFRVAAEGVGLLHYQWSRNGIPLEGDAPEYRIDPAQPGHAGVYRCVVTGMRGATTTATATLEVLEPGGLPAVSVPGLLLLTAALFGALGLRRGSITRQGERTREPNHQIRRSSIRR